MMNILVSSRWLVGILFLFATAIPGSAQELLNPRAQLQFVNPLPIPPVIDARNGGQFTIDIGQFNKDLGLKNGTTTLTTTVWGYNGHYPGPTIVAKRGVPVNVFWRNKLLNGSGQPLPHLLPVDPTIHWAYMDIADLSTYGVPIVTHLHGGHTEEGSDGPPLAWYSPDFSLKGPGFVKGDAEPYTYNNDQEAATLWYHDHAMGITRLNVYAGLAGFYILTDENEQHLQETNVLPAAPYDIGLAIQDRMFTADGRLYYPSEAEEEEAPAVSVHPEFFGDFILVNGAEWPVLNVEPRQYRFRLLNGSDSRFYNLFLSSGQNFYQIGSDQGLLPTALPLTQMLLGTGERRDVIIDFTGMAGQTIVLKNNAKFPYPRGEAVDPQTTGKIMAFNVSLPLNNTYTPTTVAGTLRPPIVPLTTTLPPKQLILFEGVDEHGRLKPMLGTLAEGVKAWHEPITENVALGSTEIWEIYNETMDAHPIHIHSVSMQMVNRQKFHGIPVGDSGRLRNVRLMGQPQLPGPEEQGWKDTWVMYPGEVTRVIAQFEQPGIYIWHCHILSHEDHEMMRPFYVGTITSKYLTQVKPPLLPDVAKEMSAWPNPFDNMLNLKFYVDETGLAALTVYDAKGSKVMSKGYVMNKGWQQIQLDGSIWINGIYYCEVIVNDRKQMQKVLLQR